MITISMSLIPKNTFMKHQVIFPEKKVRGDGSRELRVNVSLGPDLTDGKFLGPNPTEAKFVGPNTTEARFLGPDLAEGKFLGSDLEEAKFLGPSLTEAQSLDFGPEALISA